jgi:anti-sigma factor RsiW
MAAALLLSLGLGTGGGWLLHGTSRPGPSGIDLLASESLAAHRVFAEDHHYPIEIDAAHRVELVDWLSARIGQPVTPPDLTTAGYRFMGGRLIATQQGPAALFMYDDDKGTRLTMTVRKMEIERSAPMRPVGGAAIDGYAWVDGGVGYAIVGHASETVLKPLADEARRQIDGKA